MFKHRHRAVAAEAHAPLGFGMAPLVPLEALAEMSRNMPKIMRLIKNIETLLRWKA